MENSKYIVAVIISRIICLKDAVASDSEFNVSAKILLYWFRIRLTYFYFLDKYMFVLLCAADVKKVNLVRQHLYN